MDDVLEIDVENTFKRKARAKGYMVRKMNGVGYRGWPDVLVEGRDTEHFYIEFKRPGKYNPPEKGLSANQEEIIAKLKALNKRVLVTDSADEALRFIGAL